MIAAIRLLIFTGCRMSEILTLRWEHVDLRRSCLRLPDSKTGAKVVHLNGAAPRRAGGLPRDPSGWVLPGAKAGRISSTCRSPGGGCGAQPGWRTCACTTCATASPASPLAWAKACT